MKFHGIQLLGKLILQKVSGLPSFDSSRDEARLIYNSADKQIYIGDDTEGKSAGAGVSGEIVSLSTTLKANKGYLVDCSSSSLSLTLPGSPSAGDKVAIKDYKGNASNNNITLDRNGSNIEGNANDFVINTDYHGMELVYTDSSSGGVRTLESHGPAVWQ